MNARQGVVLYGPPASGKDTITAALIELNSRFRPFARLKVGSGKMNGYREGTPGDLRALQASGGLIYANARYGNTYVLDRPGLDSAFAAGVPVVHLGQVNGIRALVDGYPAAWAVVLLWCPRSVAEKRSKRRGDPDTAERMAAWDATRQDLDAHPDVAWDLAVDTVATPPRTAAQIIKNLLSTRAEWASA